MNKLVIFLIGIVLVGVAGFALLWFGVGRELQPLAAGVLVDCRDGRFEDIYDRAHPRFREGRTLEQFKAYWAEVEKRNGVFREILRRVGVASHADAGGTRKGLTLEVGFQKGAATARFEFLAADPDPLMLHFAIQADTPDRVEHDDRSGLEAQVRAVMVHYNEGDFTAFYTDLAPELQMAWTQKKLIAQLGELRANKAGAFVDLEITETKEGVHDAVIQVCKARFEKGAATLTVTHRYGAGRWDIVGFEID